MANTPETYAAVDLGSNSFHMIVAHWADGRMQVVDKLKDTVRLAGGLDANQKLTDEAAARALECLQRFGQRIREIPPTNVRAVGTNTLRQARNSRSFLKKASQTLGHNIGIISGREEARLIFLGIAYSNYHETEQRLIIDIGGGSTELAIGQGYNARLTESLYMGCVSMSDRYFSNGEITAKKMRKAILAARQELESIENKYRKAGWTTVYGSSGTILAIRDVLKEQGSTDIHISRASLEKLKNDLIDAGHTDRLKFMSLPASRLPVFPGGVAILCAAFEALNIEQLNISDSALREGLLVDLIGRLHDRDIREKTVADLLPRFNIDVEHARRVEATVKTCYKQLRNIWALDKDNDLKMLRWAALLHEAGLTIAHSQYHKHGAYLLNYSDLPGFSREEQSKLAFLVRCHRRKFPLEDLQTLPEESHEKILRLAVLLRLSVLLNRGRSTNPLPDYKLSANNGHIEIKFPDNWLAEHPLTEADLASEAEYLGAVKTTLGFS
jgi:exopolyphosphatase/guanosine-5'-triphosphate,3'-diphosphate pyrophosphatase